MPLDTTRVRELLVTGDLRALFVEELGWDRYSALLEVIVDEESAQIACDEDRKSTRLNSSH